MTAGHRSRVVAVATRSFASTSSAPLDVLAAAGCEVRRLDPSSLPAEALHDADGLIVGVVPVTEEHLRAAQRLRVIAAHGVGVAHIDLDAARSRGIVVANAPGANNQSVAELTFALLLAVARRIPSADRTVRAGGWRGAAGFELAGRTMGIVGYGRVGRAVARMAEAFGMRVLVSDPYATGVDTVALEELLAAADVVTLHAPLTAETEGLIDRAALARLPGGAVLVNTSRGELVDEDALVAALDSGHLAGAGLDVFRAEPPCGSPLLGMDNVVLTPHAGGHTREAIEQMGVLAARNVVEVLEGREAPYPVGPRL